jgi:hypothetical protein
MPRVQRRRALAALVVVLAGACAGCGGGSQERDDVRAYIEKVNAEQAEGTAQLEQADAAYRRLSRGKALGPQRLTALQDTVRDLRTTRRRLAAIPAPGEAEGLRERLLAVFDDTAALAEEAAALAAYLPEIERSSKPLERAGGRLREALESADDPSAQVAALDDYAQLLLRVEGELRALSPPPVLVDAHRAQLLRLQNARRLTRRLARAVAQRDAVTVSDLLLRFRSVYAATRSDIAVQRAAVRAYGRRVAAIETARAAVVREQQRLERELG